MCWIGTTVFEAADLGRLAIGIELEPGWAELATANFDAILPEEARPLREVRTGNALQLESVIAEYAGNVDLISTSPPYACLVGTTDKSAWFAGRSLCDRQIAELLGGPRKPRPSAGRGLPRSHVEGLPCLPGGAAARRSDGHGHQEPAAQGPVLRSGGRDRTTRGVSRVQVPAACDRSPCRYQRFSSWP